MTNKEYFLSLSKEEREKCATLLKNHPLNNYIDWDSFFEGEDGNEMNYVFGDKIYDDELGEIIILEEIEKDEEDYYLIYIVEDSLFATIPNSSMVNSYGVVED